MNYTGTGSGYKARIERELRDNPAYRKAKSVTGAIAVAALLLQLSEFPVSIAAGYGVEVDLGFITGILLLLAVTAVVFEGLPVIGGIYYIYLSLSSFLQILLASYYGAGSGEAIALQGFLHDTGWVSIWMLVIAVGSFVFGILLLVLPQVRLFRARTREIKQSCK